MMNKLKTMMMVLAFFAACQVSTQAFASSADNILEGLREVVENTIVETRTAQSQDISFAFDDFERGFRSALPQAMEILDREGVPNRKMNTIQEKFNYLVDEVETFSNDQDRVLRVERAFIQAVQELTPERVQSYVDNEPQSCIDSFFGMLGNLTSRDWDFLDALVQTQQALQKMYRVVEDTRRSRDAALMDLIEAAGSVKEVLALSIGRY